MATSAPSTCYLVSYFLQLPVESGDPLLALISVLLFKHTSCHTFLLQDLPDLGDLTAIGGTLQRLFFIPPDL